MVCHQSPRAMSWNSHCVWLRWQVRTCQVATMRRVMRLWEMLPALLISHWQILSAIRIWPTTLRRMPRSRRWTAMRLRQRGISQPSTIATPTCLYSPIIYDSQPVFGVARPVAAMTHVSIAPVSESVDEFCKVPKVNFFWQCLCCIRNMFMFWSLLTLMMNILVNIVLTT